MESIRRKRYLKAIGIEPWQLRRAGPAHAATHSEAAAPAAQPEPVAQPEAVESESASMRPPIRAKSAPRQQPPPPKTLAVPESEPGPELEQAPASVAASPLEVAGDWAGLREQVRDCTLCKLCATRTQTVFGVGHEQARLMVVGEGPGADEDARGEPFVGRAGRLLDEMLAAIGVSRSAASPEQGVFIANVVKCRPPGNRDPESDEVQACRPYLDRQIELLRPRLIVALGRVAAQRLLETDAPLSRLRGSPQQHAPTQTPVLVTYHPAYLLRSPREKAKSWHDLKSIHRLLGADG